MGRGGNGSMGRFRVDIELANYQDITLARTGHLAADRVRRITLPGVVDSGATRLVLPEAAVKSLGLPEMGTVNVRDADQRRVQRKKVGDAWLKLLDRDGIFTAVVEPKRRDALIGAIVLEELDLVVECVTQKVYPRDPKQILAEIE